MNIVSLSRRYCFCAVLLPFTALLAFSGCTTLPDSAATPSALDAPRTARIPDVGDFPVTVVHQGDKPGK